MTNFEVALNNTIKDRLASQTVNPRANIICDLFDFCDGCPGNTDKRCDPKCLNKFEEWLSQEAETEESVSQKAEINMQTGYIRKVGRYLGGDDSVKQTLVNAGYLLMKTQMLAPFKDPDHAVTAFDIFAEEEPIVNETVNNTLPLIEEGGKTNGN